MSPVETRTHLRLAAPARRDRERQHRPGPCSICASATETPTGPATVTDSERPSGVQIAAAATQSANA